MFNFSFNWNCKSLWHTVTSQESKRKKGIPANFRFGTYVINTGCLKKGQALYVALYVIPFSFLLTAILLTSQTRKLRLRKINVQGQKEGTKSWGSKALACPLHTLRATAQHKTPWGFALHLSLFLQVRIKGEAKAKVCTFSPITSSSLESTFCHHKKKINVSSFQGWVHIHYGETCSTEQKPLWCVKRKYYRPRGTPCSIIQ